MFDIWEGMALNIHDIDYIASEKNDGGPWPDHDRCPSNVVFGFYVSFGSTLLLFTYINIFVRWHYSPGLFHH